MANTKLVVDCSTGQIEEVGLTLDEIAAQQAQDTAWAATLPNSTLKAQIQALEQNGYAKTFTGSFSRHG